MSAEKFAREELDAILAKMGILDATDVSRYGSGHINDTFKVETPSGKRYILQRVNTNIFDADLLRNNILRVTEHLKSKGIPSLDVVAYDHEWRLYSFLEGYTSRDVVDAPKQAYDVAAAFAKFQNDLADMPSPRLADIIPNFNNTPERMRQLNDAVGVNFEDRFAKVADEMRFVDSWAANVPVVMDLMAKGDIPERIAHNDTKINNVLVAENGEAVVIDLDTTMPGSVLFDFGDMVRTSTAAAAEDEADLSKVYSKKEYFEALVKGYAQGAKFLNDAEKAHLAFAGRLSTFEVGIRFLADYLNGDTYFHTAYPDHNLVRARNQFRMVESMEQQKDEYEAIVREAFGF
jgi:thiamine kinase-like enzyme